MIKPSEQLTFVDSHCHLNMLDLKDFNGDLANVLSAARNFGVKKFLCVSVEPEDNSQLNAIADKFDDVYTSFGIHPNTELASELLTSDIVDKAAHPSCIAIGETGLDYYRVDQIAAQENQRNRFRAHIRAAIETNKPLIIHTRHAAEDTMAILKEENADTIGGVMHCFAEDWDVAKKALDLNFYISFSGIVTFKNATNLHDVATKVPADRFLIETDSPYLAPVPNRGQQNHPALVKYVAERLATLRGVDIASIAKQSTANFYRCFKI